MEYKALHTEATECENEEEMSLIDTCEQINDIIKRNGGTPPEFGENYEQAYLKILACLLKLDAVAKAVKNIDLRHISCDQIWEDGWNSSCPIEHLDDCRKCALKKALEELEKE